MDINEGRSEKESGRKNRKDKIKMREAQPKLEATTTETREPK